MGTRLRDVPGMRSPEVLPFAKSFLKQRCAKPRLLVNRAMLASGEQP